MFAALWLIASGVVYFAHPAKAQLPQGAIGWTCGLDNVGATLTECQPAGAAPQADFRMYVTDIVATSTTGTAGLFLIEYGTGTNCATGTIALFPSKATVVRVPYQANTAAPTVIAFRQALQVPVKQALCVLGTGTNTVTIQINGFYSP